MNDFFAAILTKLDNSHIISRDIHFYGTILYLILLFIYAVYLFKIKNKFVEANQWDQGIFARSFFLSVLGIIFLIFNFFITKLVLFLSNGQYSVFYQEKGLFAQLGFSMFFISFPFCGLTIINISDFSKKVANGLLIIVSIIVFFSFSLSILSIFGFIEFKLKLAMALLAFLLSISLLTSIYMLYKETKYSFSKINKIRIRILILGLFFIFFDIVFIMIGFYIQVSMPQYFNLWNNIIQPIQRFIFYSISITAMYLSFFFPMWLQQLTGVLPPSFTKLMEKKKLKYSLH